MNASGIHNFLDISTAGLTQSDTDLLNKIACDRDNNGPRVIAHEYGWWVNVSTDLFHETMDECRVLGFSKSFLDTYAYAHRHGCWWINFDQDAEQIDIG